MKKILIIVALLASVVASSSLATDSNDQRQNDVQAEIRQMAIDFYVLRSEYNRFLGPHFHERGPQILSSVRIIGQRLEVLYREQNDPFLALMIAQINDFLNPDFRREDLDHEPRSPRRPLVQTVGVMQPRQQQETQRSPARSQLHVYRTGSHHS